SIAPSKTVTPVFAGYGRAFTPSRRAGDAGDRSHGAVRIIRMDHSTRRRLHRAAMQVGLDQELRAAAETNAVDLKTFQHPLDVVARFGERNPLDPVDRIDLRIAGIAVFRNPFLYASAAGVVAGERENMRAAVIDVEIAELGRPQLHVVGLVAEQSLLVEG